MEMDRKRGRPVTGIRKSQDDLTLSGEEQDRLLTYWKGKAFREGGKVGTTRDVKKWFMFRFIIETGVRAQEYCDTEIRDLVLDGKLPYIQVRSGKGKKSRRVYIGNDIVKDIKWFLNYRVKTLRLDNNPHTPLFVSEQKGKMSTVGLYKVWSGGCNKALGRRAGVHAGRHAFGYNFYGVEKDIVALKEQLGHSNIAVTSRYVRSSAEEKSRQANSR